MDFPQPAFLHLQRADGSAVKVDVFEAYDIISAAYHQDGKKVDFEVAMPKLRAWLARVLEVAPENIARNQVIYAVEVIVPAAQALIDQQKKKAQSTVGSLVFTQESPPATGNGRPRKKGRGSRTSTR